MPSSNRGAFGRGNGTITVIEEPVMRSYRRKAKIVFYVTWVITAVLAATVAASRWHPIIALLAGLAAGFITGAIAGTIVAAWPVIRAIWWWAPETILTGSLVYGWVELAGHTTLLIRLAATAAIVGVPAAIRPVRTRLHQVSWCLVTRHRIRTCFSEFIITNRTGSLPLILWARPTPVGERVWIWLRPGLSLDDLHNRLDKIAVACWASAALADAASASNVTTRREGIHQLRHYYASVMLAGGVSIKELAEYLGHSDPAFTLRVYAHMLPCSHDRARAVISERFSRVIGPGS